MNVRSVRMPMLDMCTPARKGFEQLNAYARDRAAQHLPAWAAFNRALGNDGSVGIWHETFRLAPGASECVYVNMPHWGLAQAAEHLPVAGRMNSAKGRMGQSEE